MDRGYCLKWNKYGTVFQSSFLNLFASQELTDMTFVIDGEFIKCHRIIISAASSYFRNILVNLKEPNPVIVLNDISYSTFRALIDFIYCGEIEVHQSFLGAVVRAGEKYCIEGLKESEESLVNHSLPDEPMNISGEPCPKMYKYNINRDFEEEVENEQNLTSHHEIDETYEEDEQRKAITVDIGQSTLDDPAAVKEETHLVEEESLVQESETNLSVVENPDASSSVYSQDISFSTPVYGQELQSNDHSGERQGVYDKPRTKRLVSRPRTKVKFQEQWMEQFLWVEPVQDNEHAARCIICSSDILVNATGRHALRSHAQGKKNNSLLPFLCPGIVYGCKV
ncbi:modifier of mdg4-like isoform X4 [Artemia franciscana]|uniref:modifier of mdg4-like isoform X4 n=1 Tax=Artemia franciscana TaxID=6661 RepID=UPI0032D9E925